MQSIRATAEQQKTKAPNGQSSQTTTHHQQHHACESCGVRTHAPQKTPMDSVTHAPHPQARCTRLESPRKTSKSQELSSVASTHESSAIAGQWYLQDSKASTTASGEEFPYTRSTSPHFCNRHDTSHSPIGTKYREWTAYSLQSCWRSRRDKQTVSYRIVRTANAKGSNCIGLGARITVLICIVLPGLDYRSVSVSVWAAARAHTQTHTCLHACTRARTHNHRQAHTHTHTDMHMRAHRHVVFV